MSIIKVAKVGVATVRLIMAVKAFVKAIRS